MAKKEEVIMEPLERCPICGGELLKKEVEKLLRGGGHVAIVKVHARVCSHCGERLYTEDTIRYFEKIRRKLQKQELSDLRPIGQSFTVPVEEM